MLPELTAAGARALDLAHELARQQGAAALRPEHLLHGLLAEEEGHAGVLATAGGLDWVAYRRAAPMIPAAASTAAPLALDPLVSSVFSLARDLARELAGDSEVSGAMLLLALLQTDDKLCHEMAALGLRLSRLDETVQASRVPPLQVDEPLNLDEPIESIELSRVLDASANRAREGLRVVEDYCRFVLDDVFLCGELKRMRHDLTAALAEFAPDLLAGRDTANDVGTTLTTAAEQRRASLVSVVQANLKRLQEALRSLEEFGKVRSAELGGRLEGLRYRSYILEKAILSGMEARRRLEDARLYVLLTGARCKIGLERTIAEAAAGGVAIVQLREKGLTDRDLLARARQVRRWTRNAGVLFIVNDRPDIARLVEADGVHLGQDDLPVHEARRILGPEALIGVSTHNLEQLRQALLDGASYVGVGPTFPSATKEFTELAGLDFVRSVAAETTLPAFALGGINLKTIDAAVGAGARRVAVSKAIADDDDPRAVAAALRRVLP